MKKEEKDRELKEFMNDIRKSDVMRLDSIAILKDVIKDYVVTSKVSKNFKRSHDFLVVIRKYYKTFSFVYKVKCRTYIFLKNKI
jgi:hypothetical protein